MISLFETKKEKEIKSHLSRLVRLAKSDGEFHAKERKMIVKIGQEKGLSMDTLEAIMYRTDHFDTKIPDNKDERFYQLIDFVTLMLEDDHISDEEIDLFFSLGTQLGFKKPILGILLEKLERDITKGLDKQHIKEDCMSLIEY